MENYERLNFISRGTYGVVHKARNKKTGEIVAVKRLFRELMPSPPTEIHILQSLPPHPSIINFKHAAVAGWRGDVHLVMEYVDNDLQKLMTTKQRKPFTTRDIKHVMKQLLEGVAFLHENGVMHRDLKPSNILVTEKMDLKICDFGLSALFGDSTRLYNPNVGTLWYKAPEILRGWRRYSCAVDMWSVGCIMAELVLEGQVLFEGTSEGDQLARIHGTVGVSWNRVRVRVLRGLARSCCSVRRLLTPSGFDLLERLLAYDPDKRLTAKEALNHRWFKGNGCVQTDCCGRKIRDLCIWCGKKLSLNLKR